ncbi:MAG: hypothetical protein KAH86_05450 [Methanosarcinales archaeon]|nr:hypothetical protein [Methanosarcinales archaeon]
MTELVEIDGLKYNLDTLKLLVGRLNVDVTEIDVSLLMIARAIDNPTLLPYLIEQIFLLDVEKEDKLRFSLIRVQIDCELHMNEDLQYYQIRRYVAQTVEKMLYGELLLETGISVESGDFYE